MIGWKERQERIEARGAEYRAGAMSEEQFRAYLFGMRERGEDIRHKLNQYAPPFSVSWEDHRLEASRQFLLSYTGRITESRDREIEAAIGRFVECGVTLDRMKIIDYRDYSTSTLFVDEIARFQWKLKEPDYDRRQA